MPGTGILSGEDWALDDPISMIQFENVEEMRFCCDLVLLAESLQVRE